MFSQLLCWMSNYILSQLPETEAVTGNSSDQIISTDETAGSTTNASRNFKACVIGDSCADNPASDITIKNQSGEVNISSSNSYRAKKLEQSDCRGNSGFGDDVIENLSTSLPPGNEFALPLTADNLEKHNELTDYDQVVNLEARRTISTQTIKSSKKLRSSKKASRELPHSASPVNLPDGEAAVSIDEAQPPDAPLTKEDSQIYEELKDKIRNSENVYGTLFVVGCNGSVPPHLKGSTKPKFVLRKRPEPNGLKEAYTFTRKRKDLDPSKHSISYFLPGSSDSMVVAFQSDEATDLFQIGRHERHPVDFSVADVRPADRARKGVSRFACRVAVQREGGPRLARVYASAFDDARQIFLGEGGFALKQGSRLDGFTTNGVLLMHPDGDRPGTWREVSVMGNIYPLRSPKYEDTRRPRVQDEANVLRDGSLVDLCGVTLLWRTPEGLRNTPGGEYLSRLQAAIHAEVPECQKLEGKLCVREKPGPKKAYVFISCGHVVGLALSEPPEGVKGWPCPVCRGVSHVVELKIGLERGFYLDKAFPGHAFRPCGHAASLKTVRYWSQVKIPSHRSVQDAQCPFCGGKLNHIKPFVQLTLPDVRP